MKRLWVCALLAACGGGGGGGSISVDDLGTELAQVSCSKIFECCSAAEVMSQFGNVTIDGQPITTEAQCESFTGGLFTGYLTPGYKASIAAGRIEYDGAAAQACLDSFANLGCDSYSTADRNESVVCSTPFVIPKVGDGGGCTQDYECTSDYCEGATNDSDGTCKPLPTAGQDCTGTCAHGFYCGFDQTSSKDICQAAKANGMDCSSDDECTSDNCDDSNTCADRPVTCDGM